MYIGELITVDGEMINFDGEDMTELFLEMFIALENKKIQRIILKHV